MFSPTVSMMGVRTQLPICSQEETVERILHKFRTPLHLLYPQAVFPTEVTGMQAALIMGQA